MRVLLMRVLLMRAYSSAIVHMRFLVTARKMLHHRCCIVISVNLYCIRYSNTRGFISDRSYAFFSSWLHLVGYLIKRWYIDDIFISIYWDAFLLITEPIQRIKFISDHSYVFFSLSSYSSTLVKKWWHGDDIFIRSVHTRFLVIAHPIQCIIFISDHSYAFFWSQTPYSA